MIFNYLFKKFSLRLILVVPFIVQLIITVGLISWLSFHRGQEAVNELISQLQQEVTARIHQHLKSYLSRAKQINQFNLRLIKSGLFDANDFNRLGKLFWNEVATFNFSYVNYGNAKREYIGAGQVEEHTEINELKQPHFNKLINYAPDNFGNRDHQISEDPINPNNEAWYTDTITAGKTVWSPIYSWEGFPDQVSIAINAPWYNASHQLQGVMGIDVNISQLNNFLQTLVIGQTGKVFIVENNGLLVASSSAAPSYQLVNNEAKRLLADNSEDELIRATAQNLNHRFGNWQAITASAQLKFIYAQQSYLAQITPYQDELGLNWLTVVIVPEADFMTPIQTNVKTTVLISILALFIAIGVGIVTANQIIQPILRINRAAKFLADGHWEQPLLSTTRTDELGQLTRSFNNMATHLKATIDILEVINRDLQHLHQLKDEFLANTTHELRTPLHGIIGLAQSLIEGAAGDLTSPVKSNLTMIVASAKRLAALVNDLLDFSKLKHEKLELQLKPVGIRELVEIVFTISQPLVAHKPLQLINQLDAQLPLVTADENRLQQILYNLIENAIKFTEQGRIVISAQVNHPFLQISVSDTGMGMTTDQLNHLRESISSDEPIEATIVREYEGAGLGLAITKQLVKLHGGHLWVTSQLGAGATFSFSLPVAQISAPDADHNDSPQWSAVLTESFLDPGLIALDQDLLIKTQCAISIATGHFKILVVEDEVVNLQLLNNYLSLQDYTVVLASSGVEALELINAGLKPDLILLDVMMPKLTGYEVTRQLRTRWSIEELPIILLTMKSQLSDMVAGLTIGANDYLTKPVDKDELLARLQTHLHLKQLRADALRLSQENENRLRQLLEAMPVGVAVHEANGSLSYLNQKAIQLLGQNLIPQLNSERLPEVYQLYLAKTSQLYPADRQPIQRALNGETVYVDDIEIHQPTKIIPLEVWSTPLVNSRGDIQYAIAVFQNITERKQAQLAQEEFIQTLSQLTLAYERFVPKQFLNLLGKTSIVEIQLGDQVEKEMTVLFSDIRAFTTLSEGMTPQENFNFINSYLSQMEPLIGEHYGFIDKYIGDAIMALFHSPHDAIQAAIAMLHQLTAYNQKRQQVGEAPVAIGIGLNTGPLMLGTVGGNNRMDGTVIADAVNLASRIEDLTKIYHTSLLITQCTYSQLSKPLPYHIRVIDVAKVKGKTKTITVYEVYDADPPDQIAYKDRTRTEFEQGFQLYHSGQFAEALSIFEHLWQGQPVNMVDTVVKIYLDRCQEILGLKIPPLATILIVDDQPDNLRILLQLLVSQQFKVLIAKNGEMALNIAMMQQPHLILLDVMMPGINGIETCRQLKLKPQTKHIPVIFMTALSEVEDKVRGFEVGAVDYITKPFETKEVLARIKLHLGNYYLRQRLLEVL